MPSRQRIEQALLLELKRTQDIYEERRKEFTAIIAEIPSGLPHPDGQARITNSRAVNSAALEAYTKALRAFNDFVLSGAIPENLKDAQGS